MNSSSVVADASMKFVGTMCVAVRRVDTNEVIRRYEIRNTITYVGLQGMIYMLGSTGFYPDTDGALLFSHIRPGGDLTSNGPSSPAAPTRNDVDVENPIIDPGPDAYEAGTSASVVTSPGDGYYAEFSATVGTTDCNGYTINEAALCFADDNDEVLTALGSRVFARQIHPNIEKTSLIAIDYTWRVAITA